MVQGGKHLNGIRSELHQAMPNPNPQRLKISSLISDFDFGNASCIAAQRFPFQVGAKKDPPMTGGERKMLSFV